MKVLFRVLALCTGLVFLAVTGVGIALGLSNSYISTVLYSLHFKLGLLSAVLTLFLHSIVMIYFIITHKAVKEGLKERELEGTDYQSRMRAMKMETLPWTTLGMLIMIGATIVGAAVDTGRWPRWTHSTSAVFAMGVNLYLFWFEYGKLEVNTELLHEANDQFLKYDERQSSGSDEEESDVEDKRKENVSEEPTTPVQDSS